MAQRHRLLIDVDTGVDDALALLAALSPLATSAFDVRVLSAVAGNGPVQQMTRNTHLIANCFGKVSPKNVNKKLYIFNSF